MLTKWQHKMIDLLKIGPYTEIILWIRYDWVFVWRVTLVQLQDSNPKNCLDNLFAYICTPAKSDTGEWYSRFRRDVSTNKWRIPPSSIEVDWVFSAIKETPSKQKLLYWFVHSSILSTLQQWGLQHNNLRSTKNCCKR